MASSEESQVAPELEQVVRPFYAWRRGEELPEPEYTQADIDESWASLEYCRGEWEKAHGGELPEEEQAFIDAWRRDLIGLTVNG